MDREPVSELNNARILVFGASGGLGAPITTKLARAGARLAVSGRDTDALTATGAHIIAADLRHVDSARTVLAEAADKLGGLDGIVIAAGVVAFRPAAELDDDVVDDLLIVNYLAPLRIIREALTVLEPAGFVLNISAVVADQPVAGMSAYSASKAAISAFVAGVRIEARRSTIRVIDVRPPHTETGLATHAIAGNAPHLLTGLAPDQVADRIVAAIVNDETDVPPSEFATSS